MPLCRLLFRAAVVDFELRCKTMEHLVMILGQVLTKELHVISTICAIETKRNESNVLMLKN